MAVLLLHGTHFGVQLIWHPHPLMSDGVVPLEKKVSFVLTGASTAQDSPGPGQVSVSQEGAHLLSLAPCLPGLLHMMFIQLLLAEFTIASHFSILLGPACWPAQHQAIDSVCPFKILFCLRKADNSLF